MTIGRLDFQITNAKIEFSSHKALIDIHQIPPDYDMERQKGKLDFEVQHPQLEVDSSNCRSEEGLKTTSELISDVAQEGLKSIREFSSRMASEGKELLKNAALDKHIIGKIAQQNSLPRQGQTVLTFIPSEPPKINFTDNVFRIDAVPDTLNFNWNVTTHAEITLIQQAGVYIRMKQYAKIEINFIENPPVIDVLG